MDSPQQKFALKVQLREKSYINKKILGCQILKNYFKGRNTKKFENSCLRDILDSKTTILRHILIPQKQASVAKKPWDGIIDGSTNGPPCIQLNRFDESETIGSEDCLFLNVYSPQLPVESQVRTL
jgi:hypothetical protein